ncbi:MAG: restriction endonuclease subunit S, partial [Patescibacteria group bacterium]|nr:restriction endonuclease subunit S [Patescibacteria group bacterium]
MSEWKEYIFSEFVEINPSVILKKGEKYSFVEMKDLDESNRYCIPSQERKFTNGSRFEEYDTLFARITP